MSQYGQASHSVLNCVRSLLPYGSPFYALTGYRKKMEERLVVPEVAQQSLRVWLAARPKALALPEGAVGRAATSSSINLRIALPCNNNAGSERALLDAAPRQAPTTATISTKHRLTHSSPPQTMRSPRYKHGWHRTTLLRRPRRPLATGCRRLFLSSRRTERHAVGQPSRHVSSGKPYYARTLSFSLPAEVTNFIDHIYPTTALNKHLSPNPVVSAPKPASTVSSTLRRLLAVPVSLLPACILSPISLPKPPLSPPTASPLRASWINSRRKLTSRVSSSRSAPTWPRPPPSPHRD